MARFLSRLVLEAADTQDDGRWRVARALVYESDVAGRTITVRRGYVTDLASVPRIPIVYELAGGKANEAAVVHDYLYSSHLVGRRTADATFREAMAVTGVAPWRRWLMWAGVRLGGWRHW